MVPIVDNEVDNFGDVPSIVEGPIHVVDRDGSREMLGAQVLGSDIVDINKQLVAPESIRAFISSGYCCLQCGCIGEVPSLYREWLSE